MLGRRLSSKVGKEALKRGAATSYRRGDDFKPRDDINLNDILIQACETHPDKTQVKHILYSQLKPDKTRSFRTQKAASHSARGPLSSVKCGFYFGFYCGFYGGFYCGF